ncbi:MAG: hypothetical protein M3Q65_02280, partial [Chloroflexota bacterium]|nr:hypothetical protein [Chloroflexota bacterium]
NRGGARFLVATQSASNASPIILATGEPVMALGGFGGDRILTARELAKLVAEGEVRFFLMPRFDGSPGGTFAAPGGAPPTPAGRPGGLPPGAGDLLQDEVMEWVREHCTPVPAEQWQSAEAGRDGSVGPAAGGIGGEALYDCGAGGR